MFKKRSVAELAEEILDDLHSGIGIQKGTDTLEWPLLIGLTVSECKKIISNAYPELTFDIHNHDDHGTHSVEENMVVLYRDTSKRIVAKKPIAFMVSKEIFEKY